MALLMLKVHSPGMKLLTYMFLFYEVITNYTTKEFNCHYELKK